MEQLNKLSLVEKDRKMFDNDSIIKQKIHNKRRMNDYRIGRFRGKPNHINFNNNSKGKPH